MPLQKVQGNQNILNGTCQILVHADYVIYQTKKMHTTHTRDILLVASMGHGLERSVEKTICSHKIIRIQDQIMETTLKN